MVAPAYAAKRSELAKSMGQGSMRKKAKAVTAGAKRARLRRIRVEKGQGVKHDG